MLLEATASACIHEKNRRTGGEGSLVSPYHWIFSEHFLASNETNKRYMWREATLKTRKGNLNVRSSPVHHSCVNLERYNLLVRSHE